MLPARRALVSVSDKTGIAELARGLHRLGIAIVSTGGTARAIEDADVPVLKVADVTGSPEILGGRVKTLHPRIHGGILADREQSSHITELSEHEIDPIDLVVVNLYPFRETVAREGSSFDEIVENIDIGGPCMIRAAAKNHKNVAVVVEPGDYPQILTALEEGQGVLPESLRRQLALKAFQHTQSYDTAIAHWLQSTTTGSSEELPENVQIELRRVLTPRYGENPHQKAAVYETVTGPGILGGFEQHQGKELSWNNMLDADAARKLVGLFDEPAIVIVKHNNPCGVAIGADTVEAYERALACDPVSAFGSIIAVNRPVTEELAAAMKDLFVEVVVAPAYDDGARERYAKKKNLRLVECPLYPPGPRSMELRGIDGGFLAQDPDALPVEAQTWECPTARQPTAEELAGMRFAWRVCRYVKSNAIVLTSAIQSIGIGAGQMSRVDSCKIAIDKAELPVQGSVAASDAFFPFRDGLDTLAAAGITAVVQPGGSVRDDEIVAAANEHDMAMLLTGRRHFRH